MTMIVTVTPNGSVDTVLRRIGSPDEEEQQQVLPVAQTAGGKGHNVARFLAAADQEVIACGFMGGWAGREMEALLRESGVSPKLTPILGPTRRYTTCLGEGLPGRSLHSQGPTVTPDECWQLVADVAVASHGAAIVVLSGSLPPGAPADLFATIIREVAPIPAILDTSGAALAAGVAARPRMVKVNASELQNLLASAAIGQGAVAEDRPEAWWAALRGLAGSTGIAAWWVTLGQYGATGLVDGEPLSVGSPAVRVVNTTGAGDAFLAGLLLAELDGADLQTAALRAAAMAAAVCEGEAPEPPDPARVAALMSGMMTR
jgi:1-phosphofructokinase family hexose kinase